MFGQYADVIDLRDLYSEAFDLLQECTTGCTECEGDGEVGNPHFDMEDEDNDEPETIECPECEGDGEVFLLSACSDEDRFMALLNLASEITNEPVGTSRDEIDSLLDSFNDASENEPTIVRESDFAQYAEQLADEICPFPSNSEAGQALQSWPYRHIDWEAAANELRYDYHEVDFDGTTYLMRSY